MDEASGAARVGDPPAGSGRICEGRSFLDGGPKLPFASAGDDHLQGQTSPHTLGQGWGEGAVWEEGGQDEKAKRRGRRGAGAEEEGGEGLGGRMAG